MPHDGDKGAFSADIPDDAIAAALAAVEKGTKGVAAGAEPASGEGGEAEVATPGELERLRVQLEASQARARQVYEQLKEEHDRHLRAAADLENYRRRASREKEEIQRYGIERLVKDVLPVLDSLDRALAAAGEHPLTTGIAMTRRLLEETLGRFGVKGFSAAGEAFDPRLHEALMTVETAAHPPGIVLEEQQRGFLLHERLIRPAAVVVSAAPALDTPGGER